eukprot:g1825.t1
MMACLTRLREEEETVTRIRLERLSLRKIPMEIFRSYKDHLTSLSLSSNRLRKCPAAIWACTSLKSVDLSHNLLTEIPNETEGDLQSLKDYGLMTLSVENCPHLEVLNISHNQIESLPDEIGSCDSLKILIASHNRLDKIFDACSHLRALERLDLSFNRIEQIPEDFLSPLTSLVSLALDGNALSELEGGIHALEKLESLTASGNSLSEIPWRIYKLVSLKKLHLSGNQITALPRNKYTGAAEFGKLAVLEDVDLSTNALSALGNEIGGCTSLQRLSLDGNRISEIPSAIGNCKRLRELRVSRNALKELCSAIRNLRDLRVLDISENNLDAIPKEILYLKRLEIFHASSNRLRALPANLGSAIAEIKDLRIFSNRLQSLPKDFGSMTQLTSLKLSPNCLRYLPPSLGLLVNLEHLDISHNELVSIHPDAIGTLRSLRSLDLSYNRLRKLPDEIGRLEVLETLVLSHNLLESLPGELGNACSLRGLHVDHNRLKSLPQKMLRLTNLVSCNLAFNCMRRTPPHFRALPGWIFCDMAGNETEEPNKEETEAESLYWHARHLVDSGVVANANRAISMLTKELEGGDLKVAEPSSKKRRARALSLRARAHARAGLVAASIDDFNAAEELGHVPSDMLLRRAELYRRINQPARAIRDLNTLLQRMPALYVAYKHRAIVLYDCGRYREAKRDLSKILLSPIVRTCAQNDSGADAVVRDIAVDPFDCSMLMGHVRLKLLQPNKALHDYESAIKWRPLRPEGYLFSGVAYQKRNDHEKAVEAFNEAESKLKLETSSSNDETAKSKPDNPHDTDPMRRYYIELKARLLVRRQASYTALEKIKFARRDWVASVDCEKERKMIAERETHDSASPKHDDTFLWSMGRVERPLSVAPMWQSSVAREKLDNHSHLPEIVSRQPSFFWKGYDVLAPVNIELRAHDAAGRIQAALRGRRGREIVRCERSARRLQAWLRGTLVRRIVATHRFARRIQSFYRGMRDRRRVRIEKRRRRAVSAVVKQTREHAFVLRYTLLSLRDDDKVAEILRGPGRRRVALAGHKKKWESESIAILKDWIRTARVLAMQCVAACAAASAVDAQARNILRENDSPESVVNAASRIAIDTAEKHVKSFLMRSIGATSDVTDIAQTHQGVSTLRALRVVCGVSPAIPRTSSAFRSGEFGLMMYHQFISWRVSSTDTREISSERASALAALSARLSAAHASNCCGRALLQVSIAAATSRLREKNDIAQRAAEAGGDFKNSSDDEADSLRIGRAAAISYAAAADAIAAAARSTRSAFVAYQRMAVALEERAKTVLWDTREVASDDNNVESLSLRRGCPVIEMAKTRDGWSWILFEPPRVKRSSRRTSVVKSAPPSVLVGVIPTTYCELRNMKKAKSAHAVHVHRSHVCRDTTYETPAMRRELETRVSDYLRAWIDPAARSVADAIASIRSRSGTL